MRKLRKEAWTLFLLGVLTLLVYLPVLHAGFIFDDNVSVTANPLVRAADGLRRIWFTGEAKDYWPVTATVFWIEWHLWGDHPLGYHLVNLALHLAGVAVFWAVLRRLRIPGAWLAAGLFALHPVNAETVMWITQAKNLLALLFFLLSLRWYLVAEEGRTSRYGWSVAAFVLALLSKSSAIFLPVVLLGIVQWRRRPTKRDAARIGVSVLVAAAVTWIQLKFSTVEAIAVAPGHGAVRELLAAGAKLWAYLGMALLPVHLLFLYPGWTVSPAQLRWWLPIGAAALLTVLLIIHRSRARPATYAWGFFLIALAPALGFVRVGFMAETPLSGHYEHFALLGLTAAAGAAWALLRDRRRHAASVLGFLVLYAFALGTGAQAKLYADAEHLYRDTLARNPAAWPAENNLGALELEGGRPIEAESHLQRALALHPDDAEANNNLGLAYSRTGRGPEAIECFTRALRLRPLFPQAENNLGVALARAERLSDASAHFQRALELDPDYAEARANLERARRLLSGASE